MRKYTNIYWLSNKEWSTFDDNLNVVMKDDAPEEAKESFRLYKKEKRRLDRIQFWRNVRYTLCFWRRWF